MQRKYRENQLIFQCSNNSLNFKIQTNSTLSEWSICCIYFYMVIYDIVKRMNSKDNTQI